MRRRAFVVAALFTMAPLGARPPTSSCRGRRATTPRRTRRSRRSSPPSSRRPASRSSSSLLPQAELPRQDRGGARGRPAARLRLRLLARHLYSEVGPRGSARGSHGRRRPLLEPVRSRSARPGHAAQRQDRAERPVRPADGPDQQLRPRLEEPVGARGLLARRHPQGVGAVLVVLVRPGPARGAPGIGPRRHLGHRPADVGRGRRHHRPVLPVRRVPTMRTT